MALIITVNFDYPDLDDEDDKPPPPRLPPQANNAAPSGGYSSQPELPQNNGSASQNRMFFISGQPSQKPTVDRTVKPNATNPDPSSSSVAQTDSRRNGSQSTSAAPTARGAFSDQGSNSSNAGNTRPPQAPNGPPNGPVSNNNNRRGTQALPTVDRNLKPKLDNGPSKDSTQIMDSDAPEVKNEENLEQDSGNQIQEQKVESPVEDVQKPDAQIEELKRKEEMVSAILSHLSVFFHCL